MNPTGKFVPVGESSTDVRSRISLGKAGVRRDDRYAIAVNEEGEILLTPLVSIPKRELLVWENSVIRDSLGRALQDSASGRVKRRGSFSKFAEESSDDIS